ncbi:hypothetical protein [Companilactobacillus nodensis]|uniref:Uncharacterized protein n=1 Tax=Companilactobacillus nodensis DSM 19682 = JCM 14932 = NBRC 107160 TaxID=1423775 RepID=A0A0R1K5T8_9LACO|nr:hypothetical protein [Companilactobacillus nodensis]KRK78748.1 hypothetical protein FD03_GL002526 [Companilactobacillus nodensis DSM 19682 = JCM 14932 = NBRC 107160]
MANKLSEFIVASRKRDKKNIKVIRSGDKNYLPDENGVVVFDNGSGGGNTDTGDSGDHPSAGVDYYPGSLVNGEITERYLLWKGPSDPSTVTSATLLRDVGSKMNMVGDGITFLVHLQKTAFTAGEKGDVTDLPLNYDTANILKDGYFTTTSPYPIYIKASDMVVDKQVSIPINGIGEGLSGKNVKAPRLLLTFNADKTISIETLLGYDNDGESSGATGANYEVIVDKIATFSTQKSVIPLPDMSLFDGSATGDVVFNGVTNFFENIKNGISITFSDYIVISLENGMPYCRFKASDIQFPKSIKVNKIDLINGNTVDLSKQLVDLSTVKSFNTTDNWTSDGSSYYWSPKVIAMSIKTIYNPDITKKFVTVIDGGVSIERIKLFINANPGTSTLSIDIENVKGY